MDLKDAARHAKASAAYLAHLKAAIEKNAAIDKRYEVDLKAAEKLALKAVQTAGAAYKKLFTELDEHFEKWEESTSELDPDGEIDGAVDPVIPSTELIGDMEAVSGEDIVEAMESAFGDARTAFAEEADRAITSQIECLEEQQELAEKYEEPEDEDEDEEESDEEDDEDDEDEDDEEE